MSHDDSVNHSEAARPHDAEDHGLVSIRETFDPNDPQLHRSSPYVSVRQAIILFVAGAVPVGAFSLASDLLIPGLAMYDWRR